MLLTTIDKQIIERLFKMENGYVLDFHDRTMKEFFYDDLGIQIYDKKYNYASGSKANRIRGYFKESNNLEIACVIRCLINYIENKITIGDFTNEEFPSERIELGKKIAKRLLGNDSVDFYNNSNSNLIGRVKFLHENNIETDAYVDKDSIQITINQNVFGHVKSLLDTGHYYNAVEESYKIVRNLLHTKTGKEKAHEAFSKKNQSKIFTENPKNDAEKNFREGVKFIHMAVQKLRNEKAHTPAQEVDKNLALHYIVLAGLAYDLIK